MNWAGGVVVVIDLLRASSDDLRGAGFNGARDGSGPLHSRSTTCVRAADAERDRIESVLLGGERNAQPIAGFDLGNSPARLYGRTRFSTAAGVVHHHQRHPMALEHARIADRVVVVAAVRKPLGRGRGGRGRRRRAPALRRHERATSRGTTCWRPRRSLIALLRRWRPGGERRGGAKRPSREWQELRTTASRRWAGRRKPAAGRRAERLRRTASTGSTLGMDADLPSFDADLNSLAIVPRYDAVDAPDHGPIGLTAAAPLDCRIRAMKAARRR